MGLFSRVLIIRLGQLFGDDQLGDVYSVTQQVRYGLFGMFCSSVWVSVTRQNTTMYRQSYTVLLETSLLKTYYFKDSYRNKISVGLGAWNVGSIKYLLVWSEW